MIKNERLQALRILVKVVQDKIPLTHLLQAEHEISPFAKVLCFGVSRHYYRLQALADKLVSKRPDSIEVWIAVLMGLYQLQFLDKPEYATVQATVGILDKLKKSWAKGLVNAVLRRFCREKSAILADLEQSDAYVLGHPDWFIQRVKQDWPTQWREIMQANDQHPPMSLRVNQQKMSRDTYLQHLQQQGIEASLTRFSSEGIILQEACDVSELPDFAEGAVSLQDEAAQLAVSLLDLKLGLRLLDACCAPGGKTCHILERQPELAVCVALDVDQKRLQRVEQNLQRLKLEASVIAGDALKPKDWWDGQLFDRILLDAPCSATGVIRRHPDIKLLRSEADINAIVALQAAMLKALWPTLRPGGLMVYATCSVMKQENEQQMSAFIEDQADCRVMPMLQQWGTLRDFGRQILPGQDNCDGFYYCVLQKG